MADNTTPAPATTVAAPPAKPAGAPLTIEDIQARAAAARKNAPPAVFNPANVQASLAALKAQLDSLQTRVSVLENPK